MVLQKSRTSEYTNGNGQPKRKLLSYQSLVSGTIDSFQSDKYIAYNHLDTPNRLNSNVQPSVGLIENKKKQQQQQQQHILHLVVVVFVYAVLSHCRLYFFMLHFIIVVIITFAAAAAAAAAIAVALLIFASRVWFIGVEQDFYVLMSVLCIVSIYTPI